MSGLPTLETFCVYGTVQNTRLTVLVDNESTHNFVQTHVAKFLGLSSLWPLPCGSWYATALCLIALMFVHKSLLLFRIINSLMTFTYYPLVAPSLFWACNDWKPLGQLPWTIPLLPWVLLFQAPLSTSVRTFPLGLNPSQPTKLNDAPKPMPSRPFSTWPYYPHLTFNSIHHSEHLLPVIETLLTIFISLFQIPTTLPPPCPINHQIHLLSSTNPMNVHIYRIPKRYSFNLFF